MTKSSLLIGLVSFERSALTERCILSIRRVAKVPYHIYLIDNGSCSIETKRLLEKLESDNDITIQRLDKNYGPSRARNEIILNTKGGEIYAFLDNDVIALEGWDIAALKSLAMGADLVQPLLLEIDGQTVERGPNKTNRDPLAANPEFIGRGLHRDHEYVNFGSEAAIVGTGIIRRYVFEKIGLFDEFLNIGEDYDLSYRAKAAGFQLCYQPDYVLIHDHGFDLEYDQNRGRLDKYLVSHVIFWRKHAKALLSPAYLHWYEWLYFNNEPMYMPQHSKWKSIYRRLRRRLMRKWCMTYYSNSWLSADSANQAVQALARQLGI